MAGLYIHIPFCKSRCVYCDFYSTTCAERTGTYVKALCNEIRLRTTYLQPDGDMPDIATVYLGGGTPSTLSPGMLEQIFDTVFRHYRVAPDAEITMEANPDDLTPEYLTSLRRLPVNRLSMGIQTFNDDTLRLLRRRHTAAQAIDAVRRCHEAGLDNLSIDLIYGLPGQSLADWEKDVGTALSLDVPHLSAYALIYEEGTMLWRMREQHLVQEADEELSLLMFGLLIERLSAAGYEHYEISNFARPGFRARHNSSYWQGVPYIGCGPGAHSFDGRNRQWNLRDLSLYINKVYRCTSSNDFDHAEWTEQETLSKDERYNDRVITALRTCDGMDLARLRADFGNRLADYCLHCAAPHLQNGLLHRSAPTPGHPEGILSLTRQGLFLSDGIMSDLLSV